MTPTAAAARPSGVPVVVAGVMSNNNPETENTMSTKSTTTEPTKADKLAARAAKRTADAAKAEAAKAKAEADAEKLTKAAEAEAAKRAEREIAEAAKDAEIGRIARLVDEGRKILGEVMGAEADALPGNVARMWNVGDIVASSGLSAKAFAELAMVRKAGDAADFRGEDRAEAEQAERDRIAEVKALRKADGKQWQPQFLSEHNDAANIRKAYTTEVHAKDAAEAWAISTDPEHKSKSVRSFAKGQNVNKAKRKGDPMTAKAAARLFAKAVAAEGLSDEQAMDLIAEAMASIAE